MNSTCARGVMVVLVWLLATAVSCTPDFNSEKLGPTEFMVSPSPRDSGITSIPTHMAIPSPSGIAIPTQPAYHASPTVATSALTPATTTSATANPVTFTDKIQVVVTEFIGQKGEASRFDPFHPATMYVFSGMDCPPDFALATDDVSYYDATWSPNGEWLAYIQRQNSSTMSIQVIDSGWQTRVPLTPDFRFGQLNSWVEYLSIRGWSIDSTWLAFNSFSLSDAVKKGYESTTYVVNRHTGAMHAIGHDVATLAWSPVKSSLLAFAVTPYSGDENRASVYLASVDDSPQIECLICQESKLNERKICSMAWSPDGKRLVFAVGQMCNDWDGSFDLWILNVATQEWRVEKPVSSHLRNLAWSKDGRWLAGGDAERLVILDAETWSVTRDISLSSYTGKIVLDWTDNGLLIFTRPAKPYGTADDLLVLSPLNDRPVVLRSSASFALSSGAFRITGWHVGEH